MNVAKRVIKLKGLIMKTLKNGNNRKGTYDYVEPQVNNDFGNVLFADSSKTQRKGGRS